MNQAALVGSEAWIACEVKPGPFSDERMVRVRSNGSTWVGFTHTAQLWPPVPQEGPSKVRIRLLSEEGGIFTAKVLGSSVTPQPLHVPWGEVEFGDPQQAGNHPVS